MALNSGSVSRSPWGLSGRAYTSGGHIPTQNEWKWNPDTQTFGPSPTASGNANPTVGSNLGTLPSAVQLGQGVNQYLLDYQRMGIPNYEGNLGALSGSIASLLNPADAQSNYDVSMM